MTTLLTPSAWSGNELMQKKWAWGEKIFHTVCVAAPSVNLLPSYRWILDELRSSLFDSDTPLTQPCLVIFAWNQDTLMQRWFQLIEDVWFLCYRKISYSVKPTSEKLQCVIDPCHEIRSAPQENKPAQPCPFSLIHMTTLLMRNNHLNTVMQSNRNIFINSGTKWKRNGFGFILINTSCKKRDR